MEEKITKLEERVALVEAELCGLKSRLDVAETNIKEIFKTLDIIRNNTTWILRIIVGGLIGMLVNLIVKSGL